MGGAGPLAETIRSVPGLRTEGSKAHPAGGRREDGAQAGAESGVLLWDVGQTKARTLESEARPPLISSVC